jgi:peptide deformylase
MKKIHIFQNEDREENRVLRKVSVEVKKEEIGSEKIKKIISDMSYFLEVQPDGVGLAAPQIGQNFRIFIVAANVFEAVGRQVPPTEDLIFINPKIIKQSKKKSYLDEGCFSVRWWYGQVYRSKNITIEALNQKGDKKTWGAGGLLSQLFQHEIDHLDGTLFCDKAINLLKLSEDKIEKIDQERRDMEKKRS